MIPDAFALMRITSMSGKATTRPGSAPQAKHTLARASWARAHGADALLELIGGAAAGAFLNGVAAGEAGVTCLGSPSQRRAPIAGPTAFH